MTFHFVCRAHGNVLLSDERSVQMGDYMARITDKLAPAEISGWLQKAAERAKELCPVSGIEFIATGDFGEISISTREAARCGIEAIREVERQAPELVRSILAAYRSRLERRG